jgi:hypothetical protein
VAWALASIIVMTVAIRWIAARRYATCSNRDAVVSTINAFVIGAGVLAIAIVVVVNGENAAAAAVAAVGIGFTARGVRLLRLQRAPSFERDSATSSCSAPPANTAPAPTRSDI